MKGVEKLCRKYHALLICDEVAVGFGRTGTLCACEQEEVKPDFMILGKGITGGYLPLGATITTNKVFQAFLGDLHEEKTFFHGHTYTGNQLACAVALKNIDLIESSQLISNIKSKAAVVKSALQKLYDIPNVGDIRQRGLMIGIELVKNRETKELFDRKLKIE